MMLRVERPGRHDEAYLEVLHIAVEGPDEPTATGGPGGGGPWLVHCAIDAARAARMERYFCRVAGQRTRAVATVAPPLRRALTRREQQIVDLLADGQRLHAIAARLGITYTTVRNHVQNILPKLGVHSILQTVACDFLRKPDAKRGS